jgi:hypothetical protein
LQLAQLEERQYLKQLEDMIIDLSNSLDSVEDACTQLKLQHDEITQRSRTDQFQSMNDFQESTVPIGLPEVLSDLRHYQLQARRLREKVKGAEMLVWFSSSENE